MRHARLSSFVILSSLVIGHSSFAAEISKPLSPAEAQKTFQLADTSLKIELAAAEPEVIDPVAIRFDEDGRMWVVEMTDYPLGNPTGGDPLSRIRILEDRDDDGRFETSTTFADKLLFATGVQPWKGGAFVTLSGALVYMKDTDGDGRADLKEIWFEGFAEQNSQLRANHPRLALDNWIYVANGLRGGKVVNRKLGETEPINISGMDFRFHPVTGACEAVSGNGQFGLCFDDWGNRFTCSNRNPVRHVVIEDRYLKVNPGVTVAATVNDVAAFGEQSRIFPISRAWTTSNLHAGQFTAACGVYIYRGDLLPAEFKGNTFTCDPTGNLIHREIMQPDGPTFKSKPAYEGKEFLCSPDEWFRPVNMELGPDGALYVIDMYRCVIEHPDFVPEELKRRPDLRLGDDRGRIWRIVPKVDRSGPARPATRTQPALSKSSSDNLIPLLEHPNAWQRETAQRLLFERQWRPTDDRLVKLVTDSPSPQGRVHAMSLLRWLGMTRGNSGVEKGILSRVLTDQNSQVRRQGLFAASSQRWTASVEAGPCLWDQAAEVRFAARLCMPAIDPNFDAGERLVEYFNQAAKDADDPWQRAAIRLSLDSPGAIFFFVDVPLQRFKPTPTNRLNDLLFGKATPASAGLRQLIRDLSEQAVVSNGFTEGANYAALQGASALLPYAPPGSVLGIEPDPGLGIAALLGGMRGLARRKLVPKDLPNFTTQRIAEKLQLVIADAAIEASVRRDAIEVLSYLPDSAEPIVSLTVSTHEQQIRIAAIAALARQKEAEPWRPLLDTFSSDTPPIRRAIIDGLLASTDRTKLLLDAIEVGSIKASEIDPAQAKRLTDSRDVTVKARASKLFAASTPADRAKALDDYQPVLQLKGDSKNGQIVFEKNCAACHRVGGIGINVAPDISDSRTKKPEQLLADIIQPNRAIDNNFLGYSVRQLDGTVLTGILTAETATSITLKQQGGKEAVIPRSDIDELRSSGQSLMPEGVERNIPPQDMADVIAFIKNWRYLDGRTPLAEGH